MMICTVSVQQTRLLLESFHMIRCLHQQKCESLRFEYPDLTVQRLVPLSHHKIRCVPDKAANTLQPIQVLLVLNLNRD